ASGAEGQCEQAVSISMANVEAGGDPAPLVRNGQQLAQLAEPSEIIQRAGSSGLTEALDHIGAVEGFVEPPEVFTRRDNLDLVTLRPDSVVITSPIRPTPNQLGNGKIEIDQALNRLGENPIGAGAKDLGQSFWNGNDANVRFPGDEAAPQEFVG